MDYELAKKLKEAGFPQKELEVEDFTLCQHNNGDIHEIDEHCELIRIPTLSELVKACGDEFMLTMLTNEGGPDNDRWQAWQGSTNPYVMMGESGAIHECGGRTPEEAVANLWLKINTK